MRLLQRPDKILSAIRLLKEGHANSDAAIRESMSGNSLSLAAPIPSIVCGRESAKRQPPDRSDSLCAIFPFGSREVNRRVLFQARRPFSNGCPWTLSPCPILPGGTTLIDLNEGSNVMRPTHVVTSPMPLTRLRARRIAKSGAKGLRLGALVRMAQAADNVEVARNFQRSPVASPCSKPTEFEHGRSLGGNVLAAHPCPYFRECLRAMQ